MKNNQRGFTLLEAMIVLVLFGLVAAIALPSLSGWREGSESKSAARDILYGLRNARSTAISKNTPIAVTIDMSGRALSYDGVNLNFSDRTKIAADADITSLAASGTRTIIFDPQGSADTVMFIRVNEDPDLTIQLGLNGIARM